MIEADTEDDKLEELLLPYKDYLTYRDTNHQSSSGDPMGPGEGDPLGSGSAGSEDQIESTQPLSDAEADWSGIVIEYQDGEDYPEAADRASSDEGSDGTDKHPNAADADGSDDPFYGSSGETEESDEGYSSSDGASTRGTDIRPRMTR